MLINNGLDRRAMTLPTLCTTDLLSFEDLTQRLKIALLVDRFGAHFGGAESYAVELARELARRHDVTIIARDYDSDLDLPFMKISVSAKLPSWIRLLCFVRAAGRIVRHHGFDVVHSHANGWVGDIQVVHVTPVRAKKCLSRHMAGVLKAWTSPRLATYLLLEKARMRQTAGRRVVSVSKRIDDDLHRAYAGLATTIICPGVADTGGVRDGDRRMTTRSELGCGDHHTVCLLVARNPLRKGLPALLGAFQRLPAHYRLLVVGADQAARREVEKHPALAARVNMMGPTSQANRFYEAADLYIHPTLDDAFGMAPLEAMAHGLPVVLSSRHYCGFSQYLTDREHALLLNDPHDEREIAQAITHLAEDETLRNRVNAGARQIVRAHSWQKAALRYETLYREALHEKQSLKQHCKNV